MGNQDAGDAGGQRANALGGNQRDEDRQSDSAVQAQAGQRASLPRSARRRSLLFPRHRLGQAQLEEQEQPQWKQPRRHSAWFVEPQGQRARLARLLSLETVAPRSELARGGAYNAQPSDVAEGQQLVSPPLPSGAPKARDYWGRAVHFYQASCPAGDQTPPDRDLRGPGDFFGTRQSGLPPLQTAQLSDLRTLEDARAAAKSLFESDPDLSRPEHAALAGQVAAVGKAPAVDGAAPARGRFDVGTVAALGVALGSISAVLVGLFTKFVDLGWWIPMGVLGIVLSISGPSMLIAWLKLRQRSLGPILDASGWAINGRMRLNVRLGASLSQTAGLPQGTRRLRDPLDGLADAETRISAGDYDTRAHVVGAGPELAGLGESFNRMAERLGSVEETRRRLLSDVAHEMRTPIAVLPAWRPSPTASRFGTTKPWASWNNRPSDSPDSPATSTTCRGPRRAASRSIWQSARRRTPARRPRRGTASKRPRSMLRWLRSSRGSTREIDGCR